MAIKIYNTLSRAKQTFTPLAAGKVKMYVCGPTVYDYIHIGNARPLIFFDVVRRYLHHTGLDVTYIVNFTDVDDKLIRKAEQMQCTVPEVADRFIQAFYEDIDLLGVRRANAHPRVTENIAEIIQFIADLLARDFAYESGGDVYFRTERFAEYGKLSQQNLADLQFGIRVEVDERKHRPHDFVLWKQAKPGEINWSAPWGDGRPGWHIECSAMVKKYLGLTIDIHGGGHDLTFPHHECEIAQSEACNGHALANYWMHNGYIHINNEKMSKSLGNSILVRDILTQVSTPALRYFVLSTHYRNPLNFTDEALAQAEKSVERIANCVENVHHRLSLFEQSGGDVALDSALAASLASVVALFEEKMNDDFNTADAITAVFEWVSVCNVALQRADITRVDVEAMAATFNTLNQVLSIYMEQAADLLDEEVERLIAERTEARKAKNWSRADDIRQLLTDRGIVLEDTPQGLRWRRA
jgi:cysteinyl-tRNA synthetase